MSQKNMNLNNDSVLTGGNHENMIILLPENESNLMVMKIHWHGQEQRPLLYIYILSRVYTPHQKPTFKYVPGQMLVKTKAIQKSEKTEKGHFCP